MSQVFVLDTNKQSLNPVHPARARWLLTSGKAAVFKHFPFTIILKTAIEKPEIHPLRIKIDPGSSVTGLALVNDATGQGVFAAELQHRGHAIKKALDGRRAARRGRRQRKTRYRQPRFANRKRPDGWVPPSLESRVTNIVTWVPMVVRGKGVSPLRITAKGHGCRRLCNVNAIGFPCSKPKGVKKVKGFQTGDTVRAVVTAGSKQGRAIPPLRANAGHPGPTSVSSLMAKATKTIRQALSYQPHHAVWFAANQALFNRVAAFYSSHLKNRRQRKERTLARGKKWSERPPVPPRTWNKSVPFYVGQWKERTASSILLKVWTGTCWSWIKVRITGRELPADAEIGSPSLIKHGNQWWLHTPIEKSFSSPANTRAASHY